MHLDVQFQWKTHGSVTVIGTNSIHRRAWLWFSTVLQWRYNDENEEIAIEFFSQSYFESRLVLDRLCFGSDWKSVKQAIQCIESHRGPSIVVTGTLTYRWQRHRTATVQILLESSSQRDCLVSQLRNWICPWQLLFLRACKLFPSSSKSTHAYCELPFPSPNIEDEVVSADPDSINANSSGEIENFVDMRSTVCAEHGPVVESAFQVVRATNALLTMTQKTQNREIDVIRTKVELLANALREYMAQAVEPCTQLDINNLRNMFEVQDEVLDFMHEIESSITGKRVWQVWKRIYWRKVGIALDLLMNAVESISSDGVPERYAMSQLKPIEHYKTTNAMLSLTDQDIKNQNFSDAERLLMECSSMICRCLPEETWLSLATVLSEYADVLREQASVSAAMELARKSLGIRRTIFGFGMEHPTIASSILALASLCESNDLKNESIILYREYLDTYLHLYKEPDESHVANAH